MSELVLNIPFGHPKAIHLLYDKYAGMLLGFIRGKIRDQKKSEEYLITILSSYALENRGDAISWLALRQYAKRMLSEVAGDFKENLNKKEPNNFLDLLDSDESYVFQSVYYHGKNLAQLSDLLNRSENILRTQLKSSIDKIRKARGN